MENPIDLSQTDNKPKRGRPKAAKPAEKLVALTSPTSSPALSIGERLKQARQNAALSKQTVTPAPVKSTPVKPSVKPAASAPITVTSRVCKSCRKSKDMSEFNKSGTYHRKTCKTCDVALRNMRKTLRSAI